MNPLSEEQGELARDLFGSPCRIILAAYAWEQGNQAFQQKEAKLAAERCGSNMTQMDKELKLFVHLGLLEKSQGSRRNDPVFYGVNKEHPMWEPLLGIVAAFGLLDGGSD